MSMRGLERSARGGGPAGFTLLETLISMSILAVVLLTFLGVLYQADALRTSSRESSIASQDLQSAAEYTFSGPFDAFKRNYPDRASLEGQLAADGATVLPDFRDDDPARPRPLRDEKVMVFWQDRDRTPSVDWVEYRIELTWIDFRGRGVRESLVTKRSR